MSIESVIKTIIREQGYITVDEMMRVAMSNLDSSYYRSCQPLGKEGDFITSPEISQMFGEMIGIWVICAWEQLQYPSNVNLIELGPGRGVLMKDILRSTSNVKNFHSALNISLCDINPLLREEQKKNLKQYNIDISYISKISDITNNYPSIIIANEFFDALPIKQYIKKQNNWYEKVVTLDAQDIFCWNTIESTKNLSEYANATTDCIVEQSPESEAITTEIAFHLQQYKGAALLIDYGYNINPKTRTSSQYNATLQAVKNHKFHDIFQNLGIADLSSHVNFDALVNVATHNNHVKSYVITQQELLKSLGIDIRLQSLTKKNPAFFEVLMNQYNRLVGDDQMGLLFKSLILEKF